MSGAGGGDLREGLLQPTPCGADDFSEGTEGLAQKVLWGQGRES